ncbi:MAG TPA: lysylphosphatidylglycerol synthase domain-containing protein [Vicinamibacterales bacterium]|nr:lysylphosphatidylglycerol synthase domain-containing protein [Vicinamibacterales bacterium]
MTVARLVALGLGLLLLAYVILRLGPREVAATLAEIGWGFAGVLGLYLAYQLARAAALVAAVDRPGTLRYRDALFIRISGEAIQFLTVTGPFLAEPAKAWLLTRRGLSGAKGFAATLGEYLGYLFVSAMLSAVAAGALVHGFDLPSAARGAAIAVLVASTAFVVVAAGAVARGTRLIGHMLAWLRRLPALGKRLPAARAVDAMEDHLLAVLHDRPGRLAALLGLEVAAHGLHLLELWCILASAGLVVSAREAFLVEAGTKFVPAVFFFVPGQVGASEAAHAVLFDAIGWPAAAGFAVPFTRRLRSLVLSAVGVAAFYALTGRPSRR